MKILGATVGFLLAFLLFRLEPAALLSVGNVDAPTNAISAIAAVLSSLWVVAFNRLSLFDKLEDLTRVQKSIASAKAREFRRAIIRSMALNAIFLVSTVIVLALKKSFSPSLSAFWMVTCVGFWLGGFFQSIRCLVNIEGSRSTIAATQDEEKKRALYLEKMRAEDLASPVQGDDHLRGYTDSVAT